MRRIVVEKSAPTGSLKDVHDCNLHVNTEWILAHPKFLRHV